MRFKRARIGSVAGPHPATVKAGMSILRQGGNAVDAAVAAGFTEGVVDPHWNGIAGYGGCMVIYIAEKKKVVSVDYNSRAPQAASSRMFKIEKANSPAGYRVPDRENVIGPKAVGVPGIVAGLCLALERFGSMPLVEVIKPAIRSARYGFEYQLGLRNSASGMADVWSERFPETFRVFLKNGIPPQPGERFKNPDLARTLDAIAEGGTEVFYRGEIGEKIADHIQAERGCLSRKDMADYRARVVQPSKAMYRGYTVYTPPPPAAGLTSLQMLKTLECFQVEGLSAAERLHLLAEVMKASWPERLKRYGDPDFLDWNYREELSEEQIDKLQKKVRRGLKSPKKGRILAHEPNSCTSHLSTADADGNMVSLTQTHGGHFGSMVTVPGTGLVLGHGVARFDPRPGLANSIEPCKRPLHNMGPFVVTKGGRPFASYGIPGGRTIPNNQLSILVNLLDLGMNMEEAIAAPRTHNEGAEPIQVEQHAGEKVLNEVRKLGHDVQASAGIGGPGHGILFGHDPNLQMSATDPRNDGRAETA